MVVFTQHLPYMNMKDRNCFSSEMIFKHHWNIMVALAIVTLIFILSSCFWSSNFRLNVFAKTSSILLTYTVHRAPPYNPSKPKDNLTEKNWKGNCPYPSHIGEKLRKQPWFPLYLEHLQRVNLSESSADSFRDQNCARWWYVHI